VAFFSTSFGDRCAGDSARAKRKKWQGVGAASESTRKCETLDSQIRTCWRHCVRYVTMNTKSHYDYAHTVGWVAYASLVATSVQIWLISSCRTSISSDILGTVNSTGSAASTLNWLWHPRHPTCFAFFCLDTSLVHLQLFVLGWFDLQIQGLNSKITPKGGKYPLSLY